MLYSEDNSSDDNSSNESSREKKGGGNYNRKRPKRFRSRKGSTGCSRPITQNPSSTRARPQPNRKVGPSSTNGPSHGRVQWHPSLIAFHPLSADVSFFTALFRARGGREILSTSHAFKLMENVIGHTMKLDDVAIKPLPPDAWFLTALVRKCSKLNRANATSSRAARRASAAADDDDGSSSDDCSDGVDEGDESSGGLADKTSKPWKRAPPWLKDDEDNLRQWKKDDKSWHWICSQFPNRSPGAVKLRWYQKLRKRA
jgi:hypothetical protein